jgi:N-carbamoyl-L-amino-acid hydrolase
MPAGIDLDRLVGRLDAIARHGALDGGGVRRLALSDADGAARDQFVAWCRAAQLQVRIDRIGNVLARRAGVEDQLPAVVIGSHLDSQVNAGRFDGALGVLVGLEILMTLNQSGVRTRHPIEVASWTDEEGARFNTGMLGSSTYIGRLDLDDALGRADPDDVRVRDALERIGYDGDAAVPGPPLRAYLELHIEQGSVLENAAIDVGVVDRSYPVCHLDVRFTGETAHPGSAPMERRRNALVGAARAIVAVDELIRDHGPDAKAGCGVISVWPNRSGIIPSRVGARFDFRHPETAEVRRIDAEIEKALHDAAAAASVEIEIVQRATYGGRPFHPGCVAALEHAAAARRIPTLRLATQAAHDATVIVDRYPAAMVFCPCRRGISHHPDEHVDPARIEASANVLMDAAVALAEGSDDL